MKKIQSKLIHGGLENPNASYRSLKTPIYESVSFDFEDAKSMEDAFEGRGSGYFYTRVSNPTVTGLEDRLKLLAGADDCLCVSSGMAAITSAILTICSEGDNIITSSYLFGNTYSLFDKTLRAFGIETRFVDLENLEEISQHIDQNTRCLFLEMVTNPQLIVYDVEQIAELAKQKNIPLVVDNSVLTPYLFDVKPYPVDVEVISTTKFISGGATSVGGCVLSYDTGKWDKVPKLEKAFNQFGKEAFAKLMRKEVFRNTGCCQSPNNAYLQLLGLETLPLRVDRIMKNTLETAKYLEQLEKIVSVHYPCLKSSPYHDLAAKYLPNGAGSLINLELDSKEACYQFMDALQMIRRGTNFCDNKSMIIHPGSTIFCEYNQEEKANMRVNDGMLRLSVGLEDIDDIRDDIERGLKNV